MPTFTKLTDTNTFYVEYTAKLKEIGAWQQNGATAPAWDKFALDLIKRIEQQYNIYEQEQTAYFNWLTQKMATGKTITAEAVTIAGQLGQQWDDVKFTRLTQIQQDLTGIIAEINLVRVDMKKHQGFRGNLGFKTSDGGPLRLEKYEELFKAKRKKFIDQNEASNKVIDKTKDEYTKRIQNAIDLASKYKNQTGREIVVAAGELEELQKALVEWTNRKSPKYQKINDAIGKVDSFLDSAAKKPKSLTKDSFNSCRTNYDVVKKACDVAKTQLNTDQKRFDAVKSGLGVAQLYDKKLLDQKLVKSVEGGLAKMKETMKGLADSIIKELEVKIAKAEKKLLKDE